MTEQSMVERVAGAICEARNRFFAVNVEHKVDGPDFDVMLARAAIEAMRLPTIQMRAAGVEADDKRTGNETCAHIFRAMLDEALKE